MYLSSVASDLKDKFIILCHYVYMILRDFIMLIRILYFISERIGVYR